MTRKVLFFFLIGFPLILFANDENGLQFIENKGQSHSNVLYEASVPGGKVYLENNRWTFNFVKYPEHTHKHPTPTNHDHEREPVKGHAYYMNFVGANDAPKVRSSNVMETYHNYFIGNDPSKWAGKVPLFGKVFYENLYECIDLDVYSQKNHLKYDFIVHPDGVASDIVINYEGVDNIELKNGNLIITTSINEITEFKPYAYQVIKGKEHKIRCEFVLRGNRLHFNFPRGYDSSLPLIIDPELVFGSYSGSSADNWGYTATYDNDGNLYGGGIVFDSGYPTTSGAYDTNFNLGKCDIGISKFSPTGSSLIFSTFVGGNRGELPHSLIVNSQNQLVMMGTTSSENYPMLQSGVDKSFGGGSMISLNTDYLTLEAGSDIIVTVFSPSGASINGSTFFGGTANDGINRTGPNELEFNYGDHARGEVFVDKEDNIYIGSCTRSTNIHPSGGSIQPGKKGAQDGVIAKFNKDLTQLYWYTYVGGDSNDAVYSIKVDEDGNVFASGGTQGGNFFNGSMNGINSTYRGGQADGFILKISSNGQTLLNGTFIGTDEYDQSYFLEIDKFGDIYVFGQTAGDYPKTSGVYGQNNTHQFIHKLNPNLNVTDWSTTFGKGSKINISPTAFLVDICGRVYISGWGGSANTKFNGATGTTNDMPISPDAFQKNTDGSDFYFLVLEKDATDLLYATYYGAGGTTGGEEHVDGGTSRFDKDGTIYQAVCAGCPGGDNFPTTAGAWSRNNGSDNCNLGVIKFNFEPNIVFSDAEAAPSAFGCAPYTVNFVNQGSKAQEYYWDFGDGTFSTEENPTHVFGLIDTYLVNFSIIDSNSCNIVDSTSFNVFIMDSAETIITEYEVELPELCDPYIVDFTNLSFYENLEEEYTFIWDMGNGVTFDSLNVTYEYPIHGNYNTSLTIIGRPPCYVEDTYEIPIEIIENPYVYANFSSPVKGCIPFPAVFEAFDYAEEYIWDLGDGTEVGNVPLVEHVYAETGVYEIQLIAIDETTCNLRDTFDIVFEVFDSPIASFNYVQPEPYILVPIAFENTSVPEVGVRYLWDFGDGNTSEEKDPVHSYLKTGDIEVCLTVTNPIGECSDTYCEDIFISDEYSVNVPTAFSPNGDNMNDGYSVEGFGFIDYRLMIFNRWGQKVYEGSSIKDPWDGTFNGKEQEIGVYVYYIEATVANGQEFFQKGNITLIR